MDTGAEAIILRQSTVDDHELDITSGTSTDIVFGNGESPSTNLRARIGHLDAIVCPDSCLSEDLVSVSPILDAGFTLTMERNEGLLRNETSGASIKVRREGKRWSIDLEDLANAVRVMPQVPDNPAIRDMLLANAVVTKEAKSLRQKVISLLERMGHPNTEAMCQAIEGETPTWTHCELTATLIRRIMRSQPCLTCLLAKRPKPPIAAPSGDRQDIPPGYCISGDIVPISPAAQDGSTLFFLFADVATGYMQAFTSKTKTGFLNAFKSATDFFRSNGHTVKVFRSDSETVLIDGEMGAYLAENGFTHEKSAPEAHHQNFVERYVGTLVRATATLLHGQHFLRAEDWNWAMFHAVNCKNRTPNSKSSPRSPLEIITGQRVNLQKSFHFSFGDLVAVHIPKERRTWKLDLRWDVGIYIGQPDNIVDAGLIFYPFERSVKCRTDLVKLDISDEAYKMYYSRRHDIRDSKESTPTRIGRLLEGCWDITRMLNEGSTQDAQPQALIAPLTEPEEIPQELADEEDTQQRLRRKWDHLPPPLSTRARNKIRAALAAYLRHPDNSALMESFKVMAAKTGGPKVAEALRSQEREGWIDVIVDEIISLLHTTQSLVEEVIDESLPYLLVHGTMQLKKKMKTADIVEKLKARLCACGNELDQVDADTYSPTVSALTHATLLQIAVHDKMHLQTIDTVSAYLCQDYPQDTTPLYLKLPKLVAEVCGLDPHKTYRVKKYIYGLPDAGRAYYDAYSSHLIENGFSRSISDPCLFYRFTDATNRIYVWIHVDDTLVAASRLDDINAFKETMKKRFKITVNEAADQHLGVNIEHLPDGSLKLTQSKLLRVVFTEFPVEGDGSRRRHLVPLIPNKTPKNHDLIDRTIYLHLLGMLNYLLRSRPDIATALSFAATKAVSPTQDDFDNLLDIVRYLWRTQDVGLTIRPGDSTAPLHLHCYVDASFLTHPDSRGHSGYCLCLGDLGSFYSKSMKQTMVATSSTHAEIKALYQLVVDLVYVIHTCEEIGRPVHLPAVIFEDNLPAVQLSEPLSSRAKKSRHFLMLVNFIREYVILGLITIKKIKSEDNVADLLTKPLDFKSFAEKAARLLGLDSYPSELDA